MYDSFAFVRTFSKIIRIIKEFIIGIINSYVDIHSLWLSIGFIDASMKNKIVVCTYVAIATRPHNLVSESLINVEKFICFDGLGT